MTDLDYELDVRIDPEQLDVEWLDQPGKMLIYSKEAAEARRQMDLAKERVDVVRAELNKKIRSSPETYGLQKVTEGGVEATITLQDEYKEAISDYVDAKYEAEMARGAVAAIEARKDALENLVRLYGQQYFAGPSAPRDLTREWEQREHQKRANAAVKIGQKRRERMT